MHRNMRAQKEPHTVSAVLEVEGWQKYARLGPQASAQRSPRSPVQWTGPASTAPCEPQCAHMSLTCSPGPYPESTEDHSVPGPQAATPHSACMEVAPSA